MKVSKIGFRVAILMLLIGISTKTLAQTYVKLNGLYLLGGVINPAVEFTISDHSTFQTEIVYSPWNAIRYKGVNRPMNFGILMNEYRYYFKEHNSGWYVGGNVGVMAFNMTKPTFTDGKFGMKDNSSKGYGIMLGVDAGYEWVFKEKWILDAYIGFAYFNSKYNGYSLIDGLVDGGRVYNKGEIIMTPHRDQQPNPLDPFNGSAEWLPNKIGLSIGVLIFDPQKNR